MADARLPAPPGPPAPELPQQPLQPVQPHVLDQPVPTQQIQHMAQLNWSHLSQNFQESQKKMQKYICLE